MKKQINDVDDFNDHCEMLLTGFCELLEGDSRYTRHLTDEEKDYYSCEYPTVTYVYTKDGCDIIERYISRLFEVGEKYFDEFDLDISTSLYVDLDF